MSIFDTANYILKSIGGDMSAMKLQKLCYYSQAWTLAWDNEELFSEDFLKWDNGPVCRELFDRHQGLFFVSTDIIDTSKLKGDLSVDKMKNIDQVLEDYGGYSGSDLSEMTHKEKPWIETPKNAVISKELIKNYYSSLIENE